MPEKYLDINGVKKIRDLVAQDINNHHDVTKQDAGDYATKTELAQIAGFDGNVVFESGSTLTQESCDWLNSLFDGLNTQAIYVFKWKEIHNPKAGIGFIRLYPTYWYIYLYTYDNVSGGGSTSYAGALNCVAGYCWYQGKSPSGIPIPLSLSPFSMQVAPSLQQYFVNSQQWDVVPTKDHTQPVVSKGIQQALESKQSVIMPANYSDIELIFNPSSVAKGDIIQFDALGDGQQKRFRVIKVEYDGITIMSLDPYKTNFYSDSMSHFVAFMPSGAGSYTNYSGSDIDNYANNTYYNSLSTAVQNAIIPVTRTQYAYNKLSLAPAYTDISVAYDGYIKFGYHDIGERNCFTLDLNDIQEYFDAYYQSITFDELAQMLELSTTTNAEWLTSALRAGSTSGIACIDNSYKDVRVYSPSSLYNRADIHVAFKIDLSQIEYTKEGE